MITKLMTVVQTVLGLVFIFANCTVAALISIHFIYGIV